jgi:hypothetical protein
VGSTDPSSDVHLQYASWTEYDFFAPLPEKVNMIENCYLLVGCV